MKRKSIGGFVTGLIGVVGAAFISYFIYVILAFSSLATEATTEITILQILCYAYFASVILGIIAVCFYFKKARLGGFLMLGATICNIAFPAYMLLSGTSLEGLSSIIFMSAPAILLIISTFLGIFSKQVQVYQPENIARPQVEKYCHNCGTTLKGTDEFCHRCGTKQ